MNVLYIIVPIGVLMALGFVGAFIWAANKGQYDDLDTPSLRMLTDEHTKEGQDARKG